MSTNFLQIEPGHEKSNRWRNTVGVLVFVFAIFGGMLAQSSSDPLHDTVVETLEQNIPFSGERIAYVSAAGDITIEQVLPSLPELEGQMPPADKFSAVSIIVKDVASGMTMYAKEPYQERPIASITKLMSALVALERQPDWKQTMQVVQDNNLSDSHMYAGDTYTLDELWQAALIGSSNKAIMTLADASGWPRDAFVERMNQKAQELGMNNTRFVEPTGLEPDNVSNASDVTMLLQEAMMHDEIRNAVLTKEQSLYSEEREKAHHLWNTNWLLLGWVPHQFMDIVGGKTGYIPESGYNFSVILADGEGHEISVVILGAKDHESRFTEARDIGKWVFEQYKWPDEDFPTS